MGSYSSVACSEVPGTARETGDIQAGFNCSVRLQCDWNLRYALMSDLLSTPRPWPKTPGGSGLVPYAINASSSWIGLEGNLAGLSGQETNPTIANVDVTYSTSIVDVATESIEPNMEAIPLNHTNFNWLASPGQSAPLLEGEAPPLILRSLNLVRTRYKLSTVNNDFIGMVGCVNQNPYASSLLGGLVFPAESLLFLPAPINRSLTNLTTSGWTVTARFSYKPQGWNKYWRARTQSWESIYLYGGTVPYLSYPLGDFSNLFA